eukprot:CAMPEP_0115021964 /NCGR_PEP_ID=MMETSP0216-20121206/31225_1 /TAXON_ID=223996 /ORGANISM="Protocruzia adherens, Strain Boccale" /LENGTH=263 /DNA_ID=CAMNT_0002394471 /DNA_START=567 /DNA_END=1358 /DNA_ORIENTATION=-
MAPLGLLSLVSFFRYRVTAFDLAEQAEASKFGTGSVSDIISGVKNAAVGLTRTASDDLKLLASSNGYCLNVIGFLLYNMSFGILGIYGKVFLKEAFNKHASEAEDTADKVLMIGGVVGALIGGFLIDLRNSDEDQSQTAPIAFNHARISSLLAFLAGTASFWNTDYKTAVILLGAAAAFAAVASVSVVVGLLTSLSYMLKHWGIGFAFALRFIFATGINILVVQEVEESFGRQKALTAGLSGFFLASMFWGRGSQRLTKEKKD